MKYIVTLTNNITKYDVKISNYFHEAIEDILKKHNLVELEINEMKSNGINYRVEIHLVYDTEIKETLKPVPEWLMKLLKP